MHEADDVALLVNCNKSGTDGDDVVYLINIVIVQNFVVRLDS